MCIWKHSISWSWRHYLDLFKCSAHNIFSQHQLIQVIPVNLLTQPFVMHYTGVFWVFFLKSFIFNRLLSQLHPVSLCINNATSWWSRCLNSILLWKPNKRCKFGVIILQRVQNKLKFSHELNHFSQISFFVYLVFSYIKHCVTVNFIWIAAFGPIRQGSLKSIWIVFFLMTN